MADEKNNDEVARITRGLRWEDQFFREEEGLIAVFDFDYEKIIDFNTKVATASLLFPPVLIFSSCFCYPCMYKQQIEWDAYAQHVAITRDGIKHVRDKQKNCCGMDCQDVGKRSKTIPFDKITDCDVEEPAGAVCFCVDKTLFVVNVDTASSGGSGEAGPRHELTLQGLKNPDDFKKLVWAMKRAGSGNAEVAAAAAFANGSSLAAPKQASMDRDFTASQSTEILRDIHKELKKMNKTLKMIQEQK